MISGDDTTLEFVVRGERPKYQGRRSHSSQLSMHQSVRSIFNASNPTQIDVIRRDLASLMESIDGNH